MQEFLLHVEVSKKKKKEKNKTLQKQIYITW